jgi:tetratricopeptide (TPR) repeat protein
LLDRARESFEAGDYVAAREAAQQGLAQAPDDVDLLRLAGRAGVELDAGDALDQLTRVTELAPDDAVAWHDLGEALAADGRNDDARQAFAKAVELDPEDSVALMHLGHSAAAAGDQEGAISALAQAAEREPAGRAGSSAAISLVEMYKQLDQPEEALSAAQLVFEAQPENVLAALDVADLALQLDRLDAAEHAFERLREIDEIADHGVYALHGLARVAMKRGDAQRALELATEALSIDERGLSADLVLHLEVEAGGSGDALAGRPSMLIPRVPPSPAEVEAALTAESDEHRALHREGTGG